MCGVNIYICGISIYFDSEIKIEDKDKEKEPQISLKVDLRFFSLTRVLLYYLFIIFQRGMLLKNL